MGRSHTPNPFLAMSPANDNGPPPAIDLPTPLARRGTHLCGTVIALPPSAIEEIRALNTHRATYAAALRHLAESPAMRAMLTQFE